MSKRYKQRIEALRKLMAKHGVAAYVVPSTDAHQSEYVPDAWQRRPWLSGFTGSAGDVIIASNSAGLWTDGRYFLQADRELRGSGVKLFKLSRPGVPSKIDFVAKTLKRGESVGIDPRLMSIGQAKAWEDGLKSTGVGVKFIDANLIDAIWEDRPALSDSQVSVLPVRFAGEAVASKLRRVRKAMKEHSADAYVLTTLDSIAWLFNIRGRDVDFNPVAVSYAMVTKDGATLFVDPTKVGPKVSKTLGKSLDVRPYDEISAALAQLGKQQARVWLDPVECNRWVADCADGAVIIEKASPVSGMKARKNDVELAGMRASHVRDGAAVSKFLCWLDSAVPKGGVTEISAADKLEEFRRQGEHFQGLSFRTISGYADHGAIIHYTVTKDTDVPLKSKGIYLVDSGGQYLDGTTDITRTVLLGKKATREQKDRFTRVLKGHIALARTVFPEGVKGIRLDTLARMPLWEVGLDYGHGTGHGVGAYLNVHEGPQAINPVRAGAPLESGNILSNEPGYYQAGDYGIRIENLVAVGIAQHLPMNGHKFLAFETLTLCPIDLRLVESKLLTDIERRWLNSYHKQVNKTLSPLLAAAERRWLKSATKAI